MLSLKGILSQPSTSPMVNGMFPSLFKYVLFGTCYGRLFGTQRLSMKHDVLYCGDCHTPPYYDDTVAASLNLSIPLPTATLSSLIPFDLNATRRLKLNLIHIHIQGIVLLGGSSSALFRSSNVLLIDFESNWPSRLPKLPTRGTIE